MKQDGLEPYPISEAQIVSEARIEPASESAGGGLNLSDLLFILFSHKWKIIIFTAIGFIGAVGVYLKIDPLYESQAKLLVHYVLDTNIDQRENQVRNRNMEAAMNDEVEILTSWDLAKQVANTIDRDKLLPNAERPVSEAEASVAVLKSLKVQIKPQSNIILVSYQHPDPELPVAVLSVFVDKYFDKHLKTHRSGGSTVFLEKESQKVKDRLKKAEAAIKSLMDDGGIVSIDEARVALGARKLAVTADLVKSGADLTAQRVRVGAMQGLANPTEIATGSSDPLVESPSGIDIERYSDLLRELASMKLQRDNLLLKFTKGNEQVRRAQRNIDNAEVKKFALLERFPSLAAITKPSGNPAVAAAATLDPRVERARLQEIEARIKFLETEQTAIDVESSKVARVAADVAPLVRTKEVAEARLRDLEGTLETAKSDGALGLETNKMGMPNISPVQQPSAVVEVKPDWFKKVVLALAFGGMFVGVGLAFVIEMFLDRSVKRPQEFESRLHLPLMLSVPYLKSAEVGELLALTDRGGDESAAGSKSDLKKSKQDVAPRLSPWDPEHFIRPFSDAVRDRLGYHFEINRMTHKPKLIAVTGFSDGGGTSTLACGLAASLAETGDGKVLYVDLNPNENSSEAALAPAPSDIGGDLPSSDNLGLKEQQENLFIARVGSGKSIGNGSARARQFMPKKLYDLIPQFKSSDFDYIIFDMPPLGPTSPTLAMAGFMDKVLMVVDAGKTNRDVIKRGYDELVAGKADVSTVLNKTRESLPSWLQG